MFKLLLFAVIAGIAYWVMRDWFGSPRRARSEVEARRGETRMPPVQDLQPCARCGTYIAPGNSTACARADCPLPRS